MFKHINNFFIFSLRNPYILYFVGLVRYFFFRLSSKIKIMNSPFAISISNAHNLDGMHRIQTQFFMLRFDRLIFSMMANEKFNQNSKILIIGPRSESDILKLNAYGYKNIQAIDLISYSKNIKIMDAHNMEYEDNTFDSIFCGWVLPYSNQPQKIADNIVRVIKDGGLVSVGVEYHPNEEINSLDKIKELFKNNINNVFFRYDAELKKQSEKILYKDTGAGSSQILISFSIQKEKK